MLRSSFKASQIRRMATLSLITLGFLLLVSSSRPWATAKAGWPTEITERVINSLNAADEGSGKPNSTAPMVSNPQLTLNKIHVKNANDPVNGPPASTTWQPGVPITYVISLENSGAANSNISVADPLPPGFVFVSATYTTASGATGPSGVLGPPPFSPFNIPLGGKVEIRMTGYFTTGGSKINTATATAKDTQGNLLPVGTANSSTDQLTVTSAQSPVNVAVAKTVSANATSLPGNLHYTITVTNTTSTGVYLGGNLRLRDYFTVNPGGIVAWTVSPPTCTPSVGALCPDMPVTVPNNAGTIYFPYDASSASPLNDNGWLPGYGSYKIEFDVALTKIATCGPAQVTWSNQAILDSLNGFSDSIPNDNYSQQVYTTINTGLSPCLATGPTLSKIQCTTTTGPCVSGNTAAWNAPVRYRITVSNPTNGVLTNVPLSDSIYKTTGTPTFKATVLAGDPHCVSGCTSALNPVVLSTPTVTSDFIYFPLWTATLPSLSPSPAPPAVIDYIVNYAPVCETNAQADIIVNYVTGGGAYSTVTTNVTPEAPSCNLTVDKTKMTAGPIVFEVPTTYKVVYSNPSNVSLPVTVRDALSISSSTYGNFTFTYSTSCTATSGTISAIPGSQTNALNTVSFQNNAWQGVRLIDAQPTFGPMSTLTCQVAVTAHKPPDTNPLCQGAGSPQLINAAYMDLSTNYNPGVKPTLYDSEAADLPLCRSVIVSKTAPTHTYGPGAAITYTITVENKGKDPVGSFVLKDVVPPPLTAVSVSGCTPSTACTSGPTLNTGTVNVGYGLLQPNVPVSFTLTVTAPQAGGSYPNVAVGSFLPGGNFYFQGDEIQFLQQEENIQVLTPTLSKNFDPVQIAPNGTSTLTFNITNTNSDPKQTGIAFSDTLPPGLQIVSVVANGCSGNVTISTDGRTVTLTGGQLVGSNADGSGKHSCQISVKVKASSDCRAYENNKNNFSHVTNLDVSNINEHLDVVGCSDIKSPTLTKAFESPKIGQNGSTALTFTITNSTGDPKQTGIAFSDTLPPGLQIVGVVTNGCSGTVTISPDGQTVTLIGGQLVGPNADGSGKHSCKITVRVKATDRCGVYKNSERNFSDVKNLDVSGIDEQLEVSGCQTGTGLVVEKVVKGAPAGYKGQFNFLVQCTTPTGFYQKAVTVDWPTPGFIALTDVPAGSQCTVTEGLSSGTLPTNYNWDGLPVYMPQGGVIDVGPKGGHVTVTNTMSLCNQTGEVTITKIVEGLPKDYIGVFEGTLQCWVPGKLVTFPITLTSPNGLSTTISNIPLGSTCTFQETGLPLLTGDLKWDQPIYSPKFGTVTLDGECCQEITVTNTARHCCGQTKKSDTAIGENSSNNGPAQYPANNGTPITGTSAQRKSAKRERP